MGTDAPPPGETSTAPACVSCGVSLTGRYCHDCGEERNDGAPTIGAFLRGAFRELTNLEGRGFRTFRALFEQPVLLTHEYLAGRHRPWLSPLQVFLIANLVFFIALSFLGPSGLTTPLRYQLEGQAYSELARAALRERFLEMDTVAYEVFEARFDDATVQLAKTLVILLVPMFAVVLWLARAWRREPPVQHLVFGLHFASILMLAYVITATLLRTVYFLAVLAEVTGLRPSAAMDILPLVGEAGFAPLLLGGLGTWLFFGLRRTYHDAAVPALLRSAFLSISTVALMITYRMILFFTVLHTL